MEATLSTKNPRVKELLDLLAEESPKKTYENFIEKYDTDKSKDLGCSEFKDWAKT